MSKKLVGFTGLAESGKSTAAGLLQVVWRDAGVHSNILAFADPLKMCLMGLFEFSPDQLYTIEGKETVDPRYGVTPRHIMQQFGTEFVRKVVPDLWVILMEEELSKVWSKDEWIIIDDVRFADEARLVRKLNGTVVHMQDRGGIGSDHATEAGLAVQEKDIVVSNVGGLADLKLIMRLLGESCQDSNCL